MCKWVSGSENRAGTNILSTKNIFIQNYTVDVKVINLRIRWRPGKTNHRVGNPDLDDEIFVQ